MGALTTHVLDTAHGRPAAGVAIELYRIDGEQATLEAKAVTNSDGRVEGPLLQGDALRAGTWQLVFAAGAYFGKDLQARRFLDQVVVRFEIDNAGEHYHVPLLLSPFGYSTYRGS